MTSSRTFRVLLFASITALPLAAAADTSCPTVVTDAAKKAFPDAALIKCVVEKSGFEVKMQKKDKSKVELDISAKGEILQTEEVVPVATLPEKVTKAFAARYPKSTLLKAEKQSRADKTVTFEVAFKVDKALKEATFKEDGTFVEEE
jgi:biopolymer transport protein ExbD